MCIWQCISLKGVLHYEYPEFHNVVLPLLWKPLAALLTSMRSRETSLLGNVTANMEKERGGKSKQNIPKLQHFFSDSNLGMGTSTLHILTDCGYNGCLLWLLHQYLLKWFKSANPNPRVNHPWLVLETLESDEPWLISLPVGRIVLFGRKAGVDKMHSRTKKSNLKWYWIFATSSRTCSALCTVFIILKHQAANQFAAVYNENFSLCDRHKAADSAVCLPSVKKSPVLGSSQRKNKWQAFKVVE